jgi:hypothetical protein
MDYQKACRALRIADTVFGRASVKYFLCFGNLLHLIRDRSIEPDKDIDIGCFFEVSNSDVIKRGFESWNYKVKTRIDHNTQHKALYLSFVHQGQEKLPPVDVFFWIQAGKYRYHTYDFYQENQLYPSKYVFKGVEANLLPHPINHWRNDPNMVRTFFGPWNKPYFQFEVPIPSMYGSLLDLWYPNWLKPIARESVSPYVVKVKWCNDLLDEKRNKEQHAQSQQEYDAYLGTIK